MMGSVFAGLFGSHLAPKRGLSNMAVTDQAGDFIVEGHKLFGFGGVAYFRSTSPARTGTDDALAVLAAKAAPENWDDTSQPPGRLPVLHNYIQYTFRRLYEEGKLVEATDHDDSRVMAFNTGLYTPTWQAIYGCCKENFIPDKQPWFFLGWYTEAEGPMAPFVGCEPQRAEYFTNPADLLLDPRRKFVESVDHILDDNKERYPVDLQADTFRRHQALTFAVSVAKRMVEQNWQVAVPMHYFGHAPNESPISLLLPLCLLEAGKADMALVVGRYGDHQYKAFTVLSLDQAYRSARLIAKPAAAWLGHGGVLAPDQPVVTGPKWRKVSEADRCPVCGKATNCVLSTDNRLAVCQTISEGGKPLPNREGAWAHRIAPVPTTDELADEG
jgi:hypothetical protein